VNLSWNGLSYEGSVAVGDLLKQSPALTHLDISHNRINWKSVLVIAEGLRVNHTLQQLYVSIIISLLPAISSLNNILFDLGIKFVYLFFNFVCM
jgi:hypothetical protein